VSYVFCRIAAYDGKQTAVKVFNSVGVGAIAHMGLWLVCKSMNRGHQPVYNRLTEHGLMYGNHSNDWRIARLGSMASSQHGHSK